MGVQYGKTGRCLPSSENRKKEDGIATNTHRKKRRALPLRGNGLLEEGPYLRAGGKKRSQLLDSRERRIIMAYVKKRNRA